MSKTFDENRKENEIGIALGNGSTAVQILYQPGCCDFVSSHKWCGLSKSSMQILMFLQTLSDLTEFQRNTVTTRFITVVECIRQRSRYYSVWFHVGRTIITVGSLIVPALLSIQYSSSFEDRLPYIIYWITWVISLLVTTSNGIMTLFKIDKKFYFLHTTYEQLMSEAWQYIHLSGKYSGYYLKGGAPNHQNQYVYFCHNLEKIKLKQVEEEYYKLIESHHTNTNTPKKGSESQETSEGSTIDPKLIAGLYTPTPSANQLLAHRQELANALLKGGDKIEGRDAAIQQKNETQVEGRGEKDGDINDDIYAKM
jgi:hypothetical protein